MIRLLICAVLLTPVHLSAQDVSADDIVNRHLTARGGVERLRALQSVVYRGGTYREGTYTGSGRAFMAMARPYYKVVGDPADSLTDFREGYDGSAWEWYGSPGFVVRTVGAANAAIRHNLDPDGGLSDYRVKGSTIERLADVVVGNRQAYAIQLTLRDGYRTLLLIDRDTFLIVATRKSAPIHAFGQLVSSEERFSDYRQVDGVLFPFRYTETEIASGRELSSMQWGVIEVNRSLPRDWFSPPKYARTPLQEFLEHLFVERADMSAIHWTYFAFRRAYPDIDTRAGVEAIGFQMVKMSDYAGAITALTLNARDYPASSSSAFGLGRAYVASGDTTRALQSLQRAVQLDSTNRRAFDLISAIRNARSRSEP